MTIQIDKDAQDFALVKEEAKKILDSSKKFILFSFIESEVKVAQALSIKNKATILRELSRILLHDTNKEVMISALNFILKEIRDDELTMENVEGLS